MSDRYPAKYSLWPVQLTHASADVQTWLFGWFRWPIGWDPPLANHRRDRCACPNWAKEHERGCIEHPARRRELYGVTIALGPLRLVLGQRNAVNVRRRLSMTDARRYRREQRLQQAERA